MILGCQRGFEFETCAGAFLEVDISLKGLRGMGSKYAIRTSAARGNKLKYQKVSDDDGGCDDPRCSGPASDWFLMSQLVLHIGMLEKREKKKDLRAYKLFRWERRPSAGQRSSDEQVRKSPRKEFLSPGRLLHLSEPFIVHLSLPQYPLGLIIAYSPLWFIFPIFCSPPRAGEAPSLLESL